MSLKTDIEKFLFEEGCWVPGGELCERFNLPSDRMFRQTADSPGLLSEFAISGNAGFKHVARATDAEWNRFYSRLRQHGIAELVRVRNLRNKRRNMTRRAKERVWERTTGQGLLIPC